MITTQHSIGNHLNKRNSSRSNKRRIHEIGIDIIITLIGVVIGHLVRCHKSSDTNMVAMPNMINHHHQQPQQQMQVSYKNDEDINTNEISPGTATEALLNDIEDDIEDDDDEEFYKMNPLDINQSSSADQDLDYLGLADIELQIEPKKSIKPARSMKDSSGFRNRPNKSRGGLVGGSVGNRKNQLKVSNRSGEVDPQQQQQSKAKMRIDDDDNDDDEQEECALILRKRSNECITYAHIDQAVEKAKSLFDSDTEFFGASDDDENLNEVAINAIGELIESTTRLLVDKFQLNSDEITNELGQIKMKQTSMWSYCPKSYKTSPKCIKLSRYRTHSGHCNNLFMGTHLGASNTPFRRRLPPDYGDGVGAPRKGESSELPPARVVALNLHPNFEIPSQDHSALFMAWGQLLNHDLAMASNGRDSTGHSGSCCSKSTADSRICMPIDIALDDPLYSRHGISCHEFKRSLAAIKTGCSLGPRSQINTITSYVDASFVYGSSRSGATMLRAPNGHLRVWDYFRQEKLKPLLPAQVEQPDEECVGRTKGRYCFLSGDLRTNQQIQLVALHTIHVRLHNRLASALARLNPHWSDNKIYHEARHIHIALVQHILISEYLPALLGPIAMAEHNLIESPAGSSWDHYKPQEDPSISNGFAAAAFRQGHSTVPSQVHRYNTEHKLTRTYQLRSLYRQPWPLFEPGALDEFLLGAVDSPAETLDPFISSDVSGHLLQMPDEQIGLDLIAINIQRGRDQGVPGYNAYRDWCGLGKANKFNDLRAHMRGLSAEIMSNLYESADDIDLFTGGLSEFPLDGAQVGPTFACIIGRQFESLRSGDRFWFEGSQGLQAFTLAQLDSIKQVSLARLLCANSDKISTIQEQALRLAHPVLNPRKSCDKLPDLDMSLWRDESSY